MRTFDISLDSCPHCGRPTNAVTHPNEAAPSAGSVVVCIACTGLAILDDNLRMRKPLPMELERSCSPAMLEAIRRYQRLVVEFRNVTGYDARKVTPA